MAISDPDLFSDQKKATETMREHGRLKNLLEMWEDLNTSKQNLAENQELLKEDDPEIVEMAQEEIPELETKIEKLANDVQYALLPRDPTEDRDALVEIRAGAGGDEASLFVGEVMKMYERYVSGRGWKHSASLNTNQESTASSVSLLRKRKAESTPPQSQ